LSVLEFPETGRQTGRHEIYGSVRPMDAFRT
jgi:hypothetical protein